MSEVLTLIPQLPEIILNWVWIPNVGPSQDTTHSIVVLEFVMCDNFIYLTSK